MFANRLFFAAILAVSVPVIASAQQWNQPWYVTTAAGTGPGALESRVWDCYPTHTQKIAIVDDYVGKGRNIKRVVWWGTLTTREQISHPFLIGFYKTDPTGNCAPDLNTFIFQCVIPKASVVGTDCRGNKIWKFVAALPFYIYATKGERYWLQISEVDEKSVHPEVPDFGWAFHKRSPNYPDSQTSCKAMGFDPTLTLFNVFDPCDDSDFDMAFQLWP